MAIKNLQGQRFGRLTVVEFKGQDNQGNALWRCECDCGGEIVTRNRVLSQGDATSCGCKRIESTRKHGMLKSPTYQTWRSVIYRCKYPSCRHFKNYGGRGITVCERWETFENFFEDMGIRPDGCSLDRIDNDKGYFKENCRWASPKQQSRNRRDNQMVQTRYGMVCLKEAAELHGIKYSTLQMRISYGWSIEKALNHPVQQRKK